MRYLREVALAATITSAVTAAHAADKCSNATIKGGYAVSVQGETLGILRGTTVIPFPSPTPVNAVALIVFDGNGGLMQVDNGTLGGISVITPGTPVTDNGFRMDETGTYSVAADCTGTAVINFPGGSEIDEALVVGADGNIIKTVTTRNHVQAIPGNPNCTDGCDLATQVGTEEVRVSPARSKSASSAAERTGPARARSSEFSNGDNNHGGTLQSSAGHVGFFLSEALQA